MKLFEIKHRISGSVLFSLETESMKLTLEAAVKGGADLGGADLGGADLGGADLRGAYLRGADLGGADLRGADLGGADLRGADLGGADLRGAKGYVDNHDFFVDLVRRQPIETFTDTEWVMIGQIAVHRYCWDAIKGRHGQPFLRILEVLEAAGFEEYAVRYREILGLEPKAPAAEAAPDPPAEASGQ